MVVMVSAITVNKIGIMNHQIDIRFCPMCELDNFRYMLEIDDFGAMILGLGRRELCVGDGRIRRWGVI